MHLVFKDMDNWFKDHEERLGKSDRKVSFQQKFEITYKKILSSIDRQVKAINEQLSSKKASKKINVQVSEMLLKQSLIDAFDDLARLTQYHITDDPNPIKEMAYISYWFIKRKPIVIMNEEAIFSNEINDMFKMRLEFLNEEFCIRLLIGAIFPNYTIKKEFESYKDIANNQIRVFKRSLLYYLVYRLDSPKSLESILLSMTILPTWEIEPIIWANLDELLEKGYEE